MAKRSASTVYSTPLASASSTLKTTTTRSSALFLWGIFFPSHCRRASQGTGMHRWRKVMQIVVELRVAVIDGTPFQEYFTLDRWFLFEGHYFVAFRWSYKINRVVLVWSYHNQFRITSDVIQHVMMEKDTRKHFPKGNYHLSRCAWLTICLESRNIIFFRFTRLLLLSDQARMYG